MSEETKLVKALGRAALVRSLVGLFGAVAPVLVLGWLCGSALLAGMVHEDLAAPVFWVQFACFPFVAIALGVGLGLLLRRMILAPYREILDPLGPSSRYLLSGRRWTVDEPGLQAEIRLARRSFFVMVRGDPSADLRGGRDNALARLVRGEAWSSEAVGDGVVVASKDAEALRAHLDGPGVREAWQALLPDDRRSLRAVQVEPGRGATLSFRQVPVRILTTDNVRTWLSQLQVLAAAP